MVKTRNLPCFAEWLACFVIGVVGALVASPASASILYMVKDLGTLGGTQSQAGAINSKSQVTGIASTAGDAAQHAFLFDGTIHDLGTLGGSTSSGEGINASGIVVGISQLMGNAAQHAFLYDGIMHDLGGLAGRSAKPRPSIPAGSWCRLGCLSSQARRYVVYSEVGDQ